MKMTIWHITTHFVVEGHICYDIKAPWCCNLESDMSSDVFSNVCRFFFRV